MSIWKASIGISPYLYHLEDVVLFSYDLLHAESSPLTTTIMHSQSCTQAVITSHMLLKSERKDSRAWTGTINARLDVKFPVPVQLVVARQ